MFLATKSGALLVMQPAKLLENFCMIGVSVQNPSIRRLGGIILETRLANSDEFPQGLTCVFLLLVYVANLEPNVFFGEWSWRVGDNILEALFQRQWSKSKIAHVS